jgi:FAD/FMN-containing dehydrogenase
MMLTAQAGLQLVEAAEVLRRHQLQFMLNIEIGNITLGSAACCQTKDREFNAWAHSRGGIPLLNQSPFVAKEHVVAAYGERWQQLSDWVRAVDPNGRMFNPFFKVLL